MAHLESRKSSKGKELNTTLVAKQVRAQLKKEFPKCKFSVTSSWFSGGSSIDVYLMSAPFEAIKTDDNWNREHAQLNEYQLREPFEKHSGTQVNSQTREWEEVPAGFARCNGALVSKEAWEVLSRAVSIANQENWNNSDSQIDYFDVNYYFSISVGKWDKPFKVTE